MCLSTVYSVKGESKSFLLKNVAGVSFDRDNLIFTDIMGAATIIKGTVKQIDLMDNFIYIEENEQTDISR